MCIGWRLDLWRASEGGGSGQAFGIVEQLGVGPVGFDTARGTASVPWKIFRMSSVAALVLLLGLDKLVRRDLVYIRK
jgi:hypothetical protein